MPLRSDLLLVSQNLAPVLTLKALIWHYRNKEDAIVALLDSCEFGDDLLANAWEKASLAMFVQDNNASFPVPAGAIGKNEFIALMSQVTRQAGIRSESLASKLLPNASSSTNPLANCNPFAKRELQSISDGVPTPGQSSQTVLEDSKTAHRSRSSPQLLTVADGFKEYTHAMGQTGWNNVQSRMQDIHLDGLHTLDMPISSRIPPERVPLSPNTLPQLSQDTPNHVPDRGFAVQELPQVVMDSSSDQSTTRAVECTQAVSTLQRSSEPNPNETNTSSLGHLKHHSGETRQELEAPMESQKSHQDALALLTYFQRKEPSEGRIKSIYRNFPSKKSKFSKTTFYNALVTASAKNSLSVVHSLISLGADVNYIPPRSYPWSALAAATRHGRDNVAYSLVARGADQNIINIAFVVACYAGYGGIALKLLSSCGPGFEGIKYDTPEQIDTDVFITMPPSPTTCFDCMLKINEKDRGKLFAMIIDHPSFRVDSVYWGGRSALYDTVHSNYLEGVHMLLQAGASVTPLGGKTAMGCIAWELNSATAQQTFELLLTHQTKPWSSSALLDALVCAIKAKRVIEVERFLAEFPDYVHSAVQMKVNGRTLLYLATSKGNVTMVKVLLTAGAKFSLAQEDSRQSLSECAAKKGFDEVVEYFLELDPEQQQTSVEDIMQAAGKAGQSSTVAWLLSRAAYINCRIIAAVIDYAESQDLKKLFDSMARNDVHILLNSTHYRSLIWSSHAIGALDYAHEKKKGKDWCTVIEEHGGIEIGYYANRPRTGAYNCTHRFKRLL